jgi:sarcosine oxidase subunit gamma
VTAETFERSPLAGRGDDLARLGAREVPFPTQLSVRTREPGGLGLPVEPNTWLEVDMREALWLGPDEWLVVGWPNTALSFTRGGFAHRGLGSDIVTGFEAAESLVDVSANRVVIELAGDRRFELLEQGCGLDLHPRSWRAGRCAQTLLARVPVILQERPEATRVFVRPSYAGWLLGWMVAVAP